jgi:hypothetical protein
MNYKCRFVSERSVLSHFILATERSLEASVDTQDTRDRRDAKPAKRKSDRKKGTKKRRKKTKLEESVTFER